MAYVEWHQEIRNHWKTEELMRRLKISRREALGIIGCLSAWAIGHRPGGVIERKLVPIAVDWELDPKQLVDALVAAGWLDKFDEERVEIHDWIDITTRYRAARKDAKRKRDERAQRAKTARKESGAAPKPVRGRKTPKIVQGRSTERRTERNERTNERTNKSVLRLPQQQQIPPVSPSSEGPGGGAAPPAQAVAKGDAPLGGRAGDADGSAVAAARGPQPPQASPEAAPLPPDDSRARLLQQVASRHAEPLLRELGMDPVVAAALARSYPVGRILDVVQASASGGRDNPAGWVRAALEKGYQVPPADGLVLDGLVKELAAEAQAGTADRRLEQLAGYTARAREPAPRLPGEDDGAYLARVMEAKRKAVDGGAVQSSAKPETS